jgi:diguanylate cyclase (GGDEF)-like protein
MPDLKDFTQPNRNPIRLLTTGYVAALLIIAAMSICIHVFLDQVIAQQNSSQIVIGSRQAKLSQRITLHAGQYVLEPGALGRQQLQDELQLMRISHEGLVNGSGNLGLSGEMPEHVRKVYFDLPYRLDQYVRAFLRETEALLQVPEEALSPDNKHYQYIAQASRGPLLASLDAAVAAYEVDSIVKIARLQSYQRIALFVIFATLLAEAFLIFMPLVSKVRDYAEKLEMMALTDPLTGVDNYRSFMQKGLKEIRRSIRLSRPLCVCMIDIDHFKDVNDRHGHSAGDKTLKDFASIVHKCLRMEDEFGRLGGEEFGLLLPHTRLSDAQTVAERIRRMIEITPIQIDGEDDIFITASIGVAEANPQVQTMKPVLEAVDEALYTAKKKGRNIVEVNWAYSMDDNVVSFEKKESD